MRVLYRFLTANHKGTRFWHLNDALGPSGFKMKIYENVVMGITVLFAQY